MKKKWIVLILSAILVFGTVVPLSAKELDITLDNEYIFSVLGLNEDNVVVTKENSDSSFNGLTEKSIEVEIVDFISLKKTNEEIKNMLSYYSNLGINLEGTSYERVEFFYNALEHIGLPYVWGGSTPRGFDCSGYLQYLFKETFNVNISRTTYTQPYSKYLYKIQPHEAKPGDLVYTRDHTGIFIKHINSGLIEILHAPSTGDVIKIGNYSSNVSYYRYVGMDENPIPNLDSDIELDILNKDGGFIPVVDTKTEVLTFDDSESISDETTDTGFTDD